MNTRAAGSVLKRGDRLGAALRPVSPVITTGSNSSQPAAQMLDHRVMPREEQELVARVHALLHPEDRGRNLEQADLLAQRDHRGIDRERAEIDAGIEALGQERSRRRMERCGVDRGQRDVLQDERRQLGQDLGFTPAQDHIVECDTQLVLVLRAGDLTPEHGVAIARIAVLELDLGIRPFLLSGAARCARVGQKTRAMLL